MLAVSGSNWFIPVAGAHDKEQHQNSSNADVLLDTGQAQLIQTVPLNLKFL